MIPSFHSWQNITAKLLPLGARGEGPAEARGLMFILYAGKVCYFWWGICFFSMKEIPRESFEETDSGLELLVPTWAEIRTALRRCAVLKFIVIIPQTLPSLF